MARRSVLFSPGDRESMLRTAPTTGADAVVFDLEDGVAPDRREAARETVREVLADPAFGPSCEVCVRVNPVGRAADDDLAALDGARDAVDAFVLPKVTGAEDVATFARLCRERDARRPVVVLVERPGAVLDARAIAAVPATDALALAADDLAGSLGADRTPDGETVAYARERVVVAARAAGVGAIDLLYGDHEDDGGLRESARAGARLGYDGKLVVHPRQVPVVNEAFTPDAERTAWARRVVAAADAPGRARVAGDAVDDVVRDVAERTLDRAQAAGSTRD